MKHNQHNPDFVFQHAPEPFNKWTDKAQLQYCLGGTLYMPGTRNIIDKILTRSLPAMKSMVMCFEDAIGAEEVEQAESNVLEHLTRMAEAQQSHAIEADDVPLIFLRVRTLDQFSRFARRLVREQADVLSGFVFPKFYSDNAGDYLSVLADLNQRLDVGLFGMPILEGKTIAYSESRKDELARLSEILRPYHDLILNIRVGGTDFSSLFGVRRSITSSIYDILPVRDALSDVLNFFNRAEEDYVVSGPVWEYFLAYKEDDLGSLLHQDLHRSLLVKEPVVDEAIDGLLREVLLDKTNGFVGKTVIHPSHLRYVNAMQAVTLEEYDDACQILGHAGGVCKSARSNKMNEINPHRNWAERVVRRAAAYGVIESENDYIQLFVGD
ncbi:HpcH/HpaI aldolase/citrate lyase family protein [Thioalkalivibrio sp. ALM2T]|uniref:HpcH/HpaI aldolase/citrate lyase family protein n=1 Tax=Thioalkalivibrio sp. ALM2T TaxID=1158184 RepID=UPI00036B40CE|nr:HpcH/HpaI aldolase/citrate lyase family protein [Thioalkalivibrio sp. ALM2T]